MEYQYQSYSLLVPGDYFLCLRLPIVKIALPRVHDLTTHPYLKIT
jgi:hypothetical protein